MSRRRYLEVSSAAALVFALLSFPIHDGGASSPQPAVDVSTRTVGSQIPAGTSREWGSHQVDLPLCESESEMDCIEGLRVRSGGKWRIATLLRSGSIEMNAPGFVPGSYLSSFWQYDSVSEGTVQIQMDSMIFPKGMTYRGKDYLLHGVELLLHRAWDEQHPSPLEGVTFDCSLGLPDNCLLWPRLPQQDVFEVVIRTSWIKDNGIAVEGSDWHIEQANMDGGTKWTFSAREALRSQPAKWDEVTPAKGWQPVLGLILAHAGNGLEDTAFDPKCAEFGAPWQSGNTPGAGRLHWVKSKQVLDFEVHAPHLDPHGKPLMGTFTAQIPLAWLRCFAGKRLNPAYFSVEVVNEDGEEQAATTSLQVRKGVVTVFATGFHFSSPSIQLSTTKTRGR